MRVFKTIGLIIGLASGSFVSYKLGVLEYDQLFRQIVMQTIAVVTTVVIVR